MVTVYFESRVGGFADKVATFVDEDVYMECLPALEKLADRYRCEVTETID